VIAEHRIGKNQKDLPLLLRAAHKLEEKDFPDVRKIVSSYWRHYYTLHEQFLQGNISALDLEKKVFDLLTSFLSDIDDVLR